MVLPPLELLAVKTLMKYPHSLTLNHISISRRPRGGDPSGVRVMVWSHTLSAPLLVSLKGHRWLPCCKEGGGNNAVLTGASKV